MYFRMSSCQSLRRIYFHHIKPGLKPGRVLGKIKLRCRSDPVLLCKIDKFSCLCKLCVFSELYFHKNQIFSIFDDQVNFSETASVSRGDHGISLFSKILCRQRLSPGTQQFRLSHRAFSEMSSDGQGTVPVFPELRNAPLFRSLYESQSHIPGILRLYGPSDHLL